MTSTLVRLFHVLFCCAVFSSGSHAATSDPRPNVLLVVLDDAGFNDLGVFGSEIPTPNIDSLAGEGVLLTNFHVAPNCSPTRAMLLSGVDSHLAGLGNMAEGLAPNQRGKPGFEGYLNFRVAALPELLQDAGYHTYMTGKWHLGLTEETSPAARGFDRSFAMLEGGAGAFDNMLAMMGPGDAQYREDGKSLDHLPKGFYSTRFYTQRMMDYIASGLADGRPFFAYLAYTAPHWPLQAPESSIARHRGKYDAGYDALNAQRLLALREIGLVEPGVERFPRLPGEPAWEELSPAQQAWEARRMEVYAAMMDDVDRYLGYLIAWLKAEGEYENTAIVLLSDNGPEAHDLGAGVAPLINWIEQCCDNSLSNMGAADSYIWYGQSWGQAGNTPMRMYKGFVGQGGVRSPAFVHYPAALQRGVRSDALVHVTDIMPTLLEMAGVSPPGGTYRGRQVHALQGASMLPLLNGARDHVHGPDYYIGWELFGKRAIRQGDWKIIFNPYHEVLEPRPPGLITDQWQLYNLAGDPREVNDLAREHPEILEQMVGLWNEYAEKNGVVLPDWTSGY
ncbi:MAG: arylsulfatase [Haliea sp.]|uniref:arylsulfatase n=1 Tax=Marinobacter salarius TaxID=1420917 RepID=UPI0032F094F6